MSDYEAEGQEPILLHSDSLVQHHKHRFMTFLQDEELSDVTLACNGEFVKSHRLVLAASSSLFRDIFKFCGSKDPIVVLNDVSSYHMKAILQFIYTGECRIQQDQIMSFLKVANSLLIHGLHDKAESQIETSTSCDKPSNGTEETPSSIVLPHFEEEEEPFPIEELDIEDEGPPYDYHEFEDPIEEINHPTVNIGINVLSASVTQNTAAPKVSIPFVPKREVEEVLLDDDDDDNSMHDELEVTQNGGGNTKSQRVHRRQASKRKITPREDSFTSADDAEDLEDSSWDCNASQPGPSKKRASNLSSTTGEPTPSTSQKNAKRRNPDVRNFLCKICKKQFGREDHLYRHYKCVHKINPSDVSCKICNTLFKNKKSLSSHMSYYHYDSRTIRCFHEGCDLLFRNHLDLKQHVYGVHEPEDKPQCSICNNYYSSRKTLYKHLKDSHNVKRNAMKFIIE